MDQQIHTLFYHYYMNHNLERAIYILEDFEPYLQNLNCI